MQLCVTTTGPLLTLMRSVTLLCVEGVVINRWLFGIEDYPVWSKDVVTLRDALCCDCVRKPDE